jgi:glucose 1-dehydrogenase
MKKMNGKVVVITGASRGLGASTARLFAAEGASVVISARSSLLVEKMSEDLNSSGLSTSAFVCDVSDLRQVEALAQFTLEKYGHFDIWVNNAGISGPYGPTLDLSADQFLGVIQTNILGVYHGSLTAMRHFLSQKRGKLINILGRGDDEPVPMQNSYGSSKAWIRNFTIALAKEYKKSHVGVLAFNPGLMDTGFLRNVETFKGQEEPLKVMPFLIKTFASSPDRAALKILWLASEATDGKTGLYVRNTSRLGMIFGVFKLLVPRSKEPVELTITTIPTSFVPLEK